MSIENVETKEAPAAVGPYSQAIVAGDAVYTAGEIPLDPATGSMPEGIEAQAELALDNVIAILKAAKAVPVSVTVYLRHISDFAAVNEIYARKFQEPYPARSCVEVSAIPKGALIMVSAVGARARPRLASAGLVSLPTTASRTKRL